MTRFLNFNWISNRCAFVRSLLLMAVGLVLGTLPGLATEFLPFVIRNQDYRSNLSINNQSGLAASVLISLVLSNGELKGESRVTVPGFGFFQLNDVVSYFLGQTDTLPFEGFIRLEADQSISAFASQINRASNDPDFISAVDAEEGASRLLLPRVTFVHPWGSEAAVINLGLVPADVEMKLRDDSGVLVESARQLIQPRSQLLTSSLLHPPAIKGSLEIVSLNSVPLAASCRVMHQVKHVGGILPSIDLSNMSEQFSLSSHLEPKQGTGWAVLSNPSEAVTDVRIRWMDSTGQAGLESALTLRAHETRQIDLRTIVGSGKGSSFPGMILVKAGQPIAGVCVSWSHSIDDLWFDAPAIGGVPQLLIPAITLGSSFRSSLMLSNLGQIGTLIRLTPRSPTGIPVGKGNIIFLQPQGTASLDSLVNLLGIQEGFFGPLEIESLQGQPLYASSQVGHAASSLSGRLKSVNDTPTFSRKVGDSITLQWAYDSQTISQVAEFRIYRADAGGSSFQRLGTVSASEKEYRLSLTIPGKFFFFITAFDGKVESLPSSAISLEVGPAT